MRITFLGATHTVTGSKFLLTIGNKNFLVDCGLFQGLKNLRLKNWTPFPINPADIHAVILTHAHIDHSGYLPLLIRNGFTGKVYCSAATKDLCAILLPDSGHLQEEEAKFRNKHGISKHHPAMPLYTREDAEHALHQFHAVDFRKNIKLADDIIVSLIPGGHILGASLVQVKHNQTTVIFSGDLGRPDDPIMYAPAIVQSADYLILESTYGNRLHDKTDPLEQLADAINTTIARKGTILIPAFAVGRAQHLLYLLFKLKKTNRIQNIPIYLDSPLAKNATDIFRHYSSLHRLSPELSRDVCEIANYINTQEESKALDLDELPKIIISASGMLDGGRVLHHLKKFGTQPQNTLLLTGYQAAGTRGSDIANGKREIKLFGETIVINAEVKELSNMSAHADYEEILQWLSNFNHHPRKTFITHGDPTAADALKEKITDRFHWECVVPNYLHSELLG